MRFDLGHSACDACPLVHFFGRRVLSFRALAPVTPGRRDDLGSVLVERPVELPGAHNITTIEVGCFLTRRIV